MPVTNMGKTKDEKNLLNRFKSNQKKNRNKKNVNFVLILP